MYEDKTHAEVIADSIWDGSRLVTFRATFPRFILAEFNTHRAFSRNSASSRAIPVKRQIELVRESPFIPQQWPVNQKGMQSSHNLKELDGIRATRGWLMARDACVREAEWLDQHMNVHKQIASRLLEPFMWHTVIVSSTMPGLDNFFAQRDHEDAQPEMQTLAKAMRKALDESLSVGIETHIPFIEDFDTDCSLEELMVSSVARCARVSYGRELEEKSYEEDMALVERLLKAGHASPFEHVGIVMPEGEYFPPTMPWPEGDVPYVPTAPHVGNFEYPWSQLRHHWREYLPSIAARLDSEHST